MGLPSAEEWLQRLERRCMELPTVHSTALNCTAPRNTSLHFASLRFTAQHSIAQPGAALQWARQYGHTTWRVALPSSKMHGPALRQSKPHYTGGSHTPHHSRTCHTTPMHFDSTPCTALQPRSGTHPMLVYHYHYHC